MPGTAAGADRGGHDLDVGRIAVGRGEVVDLGRVGLDQPDVAVAALPVDGHFFALVGADVEHRVGIEL